MISKKPNKSHLFSLFVPLLAVGVLGFWLIFENNFDKPSNRSTQQQIAIVHHQNKPVVVNQNENELRSNRLLGNSQAAPKMISNAALNPHAIRLELQSSLQTPKNVQSQHELRSETRQMSAAISELYRQHEVAAQTSLHFPLFDGNFLELKALRHQPMGRDQGVIFAKVDSEPEGGHILLSYVGTALAGMIHLPLRGEFYEIRTAPDGRSHILSQLDPEKMPSCGTCMQPRTK